MEYGQALEYFYGLWRNEKIKGNIRLPWNEWLNYNLNISARDVRKKEKCTRRLEDIKSCIKLHFHSMNCIPEELPFAACY